MFVLIYLMDIIMQLKLNLKNKKLRTGMLFIAEKNMQCLFCNKKPIPNPLRNVH